MCSWHAGESLWRANAVTSVSCSESSRTAPASRAECRGFRPGQRRGYISPNFQGWLLDELKCREEVWFSWTRTSRNAWRSVDERIDGVSGSFKPIHASPGDPTVVLRSRREYSLLEQDAETVRQRPWTMTRETRNRLVALVCLVCLVYLLEPD